MVRLLSWLIGLPVALICIIFAVSNRTVVTVEVWPLPYTVEMPLFLPVFLSLAAGILFGGFLAWTSGSKSRQRHRETTLRLRKAEQDLAALKKDEKAADPTSLPSP